MPSSSGPNICGNSSDFNAQATPGTGTWSTSINIINDNGVNSVSSDINTSQDVTCWIYGQNFGHSIPTDATISGIALHIERDSSVAGCTDYEVRLSGGPGLTDSFLIADIGNSWDTPNTGIATYGGIGQLWGKSWTPADVNAFLFRGLISVTGTSPIGLGGAEIDYMATTIYYEPAGGGGGGGTNAKIRFGGQEIQNVYKGDQIITDIYFGSNVT